MATRNVVVTNKRFGTATHTLAPDKNGVRKRIKIPVRRAVWVDRSRYNPAKLRKKPSSGADNGNSLTSLVDTVVVPFKKIVGKAVGKKK